MDVICRHGLYCRGHYKTWTPLWMSLADMGFTAGVTIRLGHHCGCHLQTRALLRGSLYKTRTPLWMSLADTGFTAGVTIRLGHHYGDQYKTWTPLWRSLSDMGFTAGVTL